ncbi:MAG: hypothetical protein AB8H79_00335 [Myxococcota bacterium]
MRNTRASSVIHDRPSKFLVELDRSPRVFERWQIMEEPIEGGE